MKHEGFAVAEHTLDASARPACTRNGPGAGLACAGTVPFVRPSKGTSPYREIMQPQACSVRRSLPPRFQMRWRRLPQLIVTTAWVTSFAIVRWGR